MNNYIETYTGRKVYLPDTDPDSISIVDIAHALSMQPRFAGHTDRFYSVAEHSLNVCDLVPEEHKLQALLHDATEAYLCDIPTPFKILMPEYKALEAKLWAAIAVRFNLPIELHPSIKEADAIMLMSERDELKGKSDWGDLEKTRRVKVNLYDNPRSEFLRLFTVLTVRP